MKKILFFGATSAIGIEILRALVEQSEANSLCCYLVARDTIKLDNVATDLLSRGFSEVKSYATDLAKTDNHVDLFKDIETNFPDYDSVVIAYGELGTQSEGEYDFIAAKKVFDVNFLSVVSLLTPLANNFEKRSSGKIVVIGSVAGDRGRQSNYIYGAAKGALDIYLQGLRNRLFRYNVDVLTIKPGFVDTPMTSHIKKKGLLFVGPRTVGRGVVKAINKNKDVAYLPFFWRYIMLVITLIPERIFKRLNL
jgi:decaprenylphospho-beta-D-erythro-pentofuranosid-2-ulose 2-reductase